MSEWLDWLRAVRGPAALVSVLATEGSAPRGAGTRMVVTAAECLGTIGGGALEYRAVEQARAILGHAPGAWRVQDYPLGPLLGQCCGGRVRVLVEHLDGARLGWLDAADADGLLETRLEAGGVARQVLGGGIATSLSARGERPEAGAVFVERIGGYRRPLWLFGAGHVGQAIARAAAALPFRLAWFDTRDDYAGRDGVTLVDEVAIANCVTDAPDDAALVVLTHDHALDYRLVRAAMQRGPLAYLGLIGSATKRARFSSRLRGDGVGAEGLARLTCPIGIAGIGGKEPEVIAIALLAQLLQLPLARSAALPQDRAA